MVLSLKDLKKWNLDVVKMDKKGVELGLNIIVIAAIVLIVLIVVIYIIGNAVLNWNNETGKCDIQGGECIRDGLCTEKEKIDASCTSSGDVCCRNNCILAGGIIQKAECKDGKSMPMVRLDDGRYCCKK